MSFAQEMHQFQRRSETHDIAAIKKEYSAKQRHDNAMVVLDKVPFERWITVKEISVDARRQTVWNYLRYLEQNNYIQVKRYGYKNEYQRLK